MVAFVGWKKRECKRFVECTSKANFHRIGVESFSELYRKNHIRVPMCVQQNYPIPLRMRLYRCDTPSYDVLQLAFPRSSDLVCVRNLV